VEDDSILKKQLAVLKAEQSLLTLESRLEKKRGRLTDSGSLKRSWPRWICHFAVGRRPAFLSFMRDAAIW
jgi:hypothetical protein